MRTPAFDLRRIAAWAALVLALGAARPARAATLFDPALRFRVLKTAHFRIYFHREAAHLAARLGPIAEDAWRSVAQPLASRPPAMTHVVLADQTELPNAYATPLPYDTIVIYTSWPRGSEFNVDDWLRLVFTHEFTHIVHLDRSEGWARPFRRVFGRTFVAFPNLFLPTWQIEGLATYEESAITGGGRLHAGEFRAVVDEAARHRALEPLDRVNGGLTDWPGGQAPYAYGAAFHEYLAERYGADSLRLLAEATARRLPYTAAPAFRKVYGRSLGELWRDFEASRIAAADGDAGPGAPTEPTTDVDASGADIRRLTFDGFVAAGPRFDKAGCAACPAEIVYAARTPHAFPSLNRIRADGGRPRKIATRYFGSTTAVGRDRVVFDQVEIVRNVAVYGDLYSWSRSTGTVTRLTSGGRLHDPDLSPDESAIACVREHEGQRDLVLIRLPSHSTAGPIRLDRLETLLAERETQFDAPRWSPDGTRIAVERHRLGGDPEILIVDPASRGVRVVASRQGTRIVMPTWRPDGRAIVAAVADGDRTFDLVEFPVDGDGTPRQLTRTSGGALWPDVSPDGRTLVFIGYSPGGFDLFAMPYAERGTPRNDLAVHGDEASRLPPASGAATPLGGAVSPYSPFGTLAPTSWSPLIESDADQVRIGAAVAGVDVLGYHAYAVSATWLASHPAGSPTPNRAAPDWSASYAYDRWRPTIFAAASSSTSFFAGPATASGAPLPATRRERQVAAGIVAPIVRTRLAHAALAEVLRSNDRYTLDDGELSRNRTAIRTGWQTVSARSYGYSISLEDGIAAGATAEFVRRAIGASADATSIAGDLRAYLPGDTRNHVAALRLAAGASRGDRIAGRTFVLGGPGPDAGLIDFGSGAVSLLRGFPSNAFAGSHVALANAEYRWPIARPQRGAGTWPIFLHTLHAAVFADVGHAWTRTFDASALKSAFGAELSTHLIAGYYAPLTVVVGVARRHDGTGAFADGVAAYVRLGRSF